MSDSVSGVRCAITSCLPSGDHEARPTSRQARRRGRRTARSLNRAWVWTPPGEGPSTSLGLALALRDTRQWVVRPSARSALTALAQHRDRLLDPAAPRLLLLSRLNVGNEVPALCRSERGEELLRLGLRLERRGEILRNRRLAGLRVERDRDLKLFACRDPRSFAVRGANSNEVPLAAPRDRAAVGVTSERDADRRPAAS